MWHMFARITLKEEFFRQNVSCDNKYARCGACDVLHSQIGMEMDRLLSYIIVIIFPESTLKSTFVQYMELELVARPPLVNK